MDPGLKKILKSVTLELRHLLEGRYDSAGAWQPGDLEQRLAAIGVRRDRTSLPIDELSHLSAEDKHARKVVDAYLKLREGSGVKRTDAIADFVRETAYTWANRLLALRCMEARELIDEVITQKEAYGGRSLEHHRLAQRQPELCAGEDDGLFAVLDKVFRDQAERLPMLFDSHAPGVALRPSPAAIKDCFALLSLDPETLRKYRIRIKEDENADAEPANPFVAPDALGWGYQYWNTEEKDRVFERVRTIKGAKIAGADIVPATQLYTEDYMVKFLVLNSLGATWMGMHPVSKLCEGWEYYVKDADRTPVERKPVSEITFLDPACGSGHFLLEAFDLFFSMYEEEGQLAEPEAICDAILTKNLFGIDIDPRAVQIAEASLWMKAAERAFDYAGAATNLVAATASHLKGEAWEEFLAGFEREPSVARVLRKFAETMEHIDEIGSLARPDEDLREIIQKEHATWERQVRERKETNFLFPEMNEAALQGQLPFNEISDEDFGDRLFYRARAAIDAFTERARASGDFEDQLLGSETRAGFRLVDLLSSRYEVVAANPPYMGSKKMGKALKVFVDRNFSPGKRDLYAAFILRNCELANVSGRVAMVTQQSWMFLRSFAELRAVNMEKVDHLNEEEFSGLLRDVTLESLAHLGPNAFDEIGGEVVNVSLSVFAVSRPPNSHRLTAFRLIGPKTTADKALLLREAVSRLDHAVATRPVQMRFLDVPHSPLCYWLRERFFELLAGPKLQDAARIVQQIITSDNGRFLRFAWEGPQATASWVPYLKAGGYGRWTGFHQMVLDWRSKGSRIKSLILEKYEYLNGNWGWLVKEETLFKPGLTYSLMAGGCLGVRRVDPGAACDSASPFIAVHSKVRALACQLNSRVVSYLLRSTSADIKFRESYVLQAPISVHATGMIEQLEEVCGELKALIVAQNPTESSFRVLDNAISRDGEINELHVAALLHTLEGIVEHEVFKLFVLDDEDTSCVLDETGTPSGWFPLITGQDTIPTLDDLGVDVSIPNELFASLDKCERRDLSHDEVTDIKRRLRALYEAGLGATVDEDEKDVATTDDDEDTETVAVGARIPIPAETFLEELSQRLEVHPISVYWLLKEGIETEGWRCLPEERRLWADRVTVTVLRLLGHHWPKQIESGESVSDWADPDGIIPLTPIAHESTLVERVQERLAADEIDISDFAEVMGRPLDAWLTTEFFKHHTKQFKKRPIAWQLQSGKFSAKKAPAFACLVYYHKFDADTLPKIRTQYVGPLRQRLETELRGIQSLAAEARSDRQEKRRVELEDAIQELSAFDTKLEQVAREGFATPGLAKLLADEPLDRRCSLDGKRPHPTTTADLIAQESAYAPDINDGVRVNIAPLQKAGLLAADVLAKKDLDKAIADRAEWRADERRWVREGKLPQPGWWPEESQP